MAKSAGCESSSSINRRATTIRRAYGQPWARNSPLARLFLGRRAAGPGRVLGLSPAAADQLLRYPWPGNDRELENAVERAAVLARGTLVEPDDLPEEVRGAAPAPNLTAEVRKLNEIEMEYILAVLERANGNQTQAAKVLGIGTTTLYRKLRHRIKGGGADPQ